MTNTLLMTTGRVLLGLYFLVFGVLKFAAWEMHIDLMVLHNVSNPEPLLLIATLAEIIAGAFLILRYHVRYVALGCALLILVINVMMHDFWNFEGVVAAHEMQSFIKNLGIFAGFLVLASVSSKRGFSVSGLLKRDSNRN